MSSGNEQRECYEHHTEVLEGREAYNSSKYINKIVKQNKINCPLENAGLFF